MFIRQKHLEMVTRMSGRFKKYLESTKDATDSKLAKTRGDRDDDFDDEDR